MLLTFYLVSKNNLLRLLYHPSKDQQSGHWECDSDVGRSRIVGYVFGTIHSLMFRGISLSQRQALLSWWQRGRMETRVGENGKSSLDRLLWWWIKKAEQKLFCVLKKQVFREHGQAKQGKQVYYLSLIQENICSLVMEYVVFGVIIREYDMM